MKLLTRINRFYLIFLLLLSPIMIAVDYYLIRYFVFTEVNEILEHESERIKYHLQSTGELPYSRYIYEITPIDKAIPLIPRFRDTMIFDAYSNKSIPYRKHEFIVEAGDQKMKVTLKHVLMEVRKLIFWLFISTALIFILMTIGMFSINHKLSRWAWQPFYRNLSKLKNYDINQKNPVHLDTSDISEFEALNQVITSLMNQVEKDFRNLKEFNENISHEMQTPLAIIRNKMVLLLENQSLGEKELRWVQAAYQEVNKLSKIGKSLTLISRIENQEFTRLDSVDIRATIDNIISNMEEILQFKNLQLTVKLDPVKVKCDPILANILFTNLIKNAIQHNQEGGYIWMRLDEEQFEIKNTGEVLKTETAHLFNRFQRGNTTTDTLGLGLAINQKICELYGFQLDYRHEEGEHKFSLLFDS
ncbi:MAG: HAMP domain-containing sensor histidine kinase [Bacteroidota bacterium]